MIQLFSTEFWIAVLFGINFILVVFLFLIVKKINLVSSSSAQDRCEDIEEINGAQTEHAGHIMNMLEPLVQDAAKTAKTFEAQIREKKRIIKELNDALDARIININLLLSRAEKLQKKLENEHRMANRQISVNPDSFPVAPPDTMLDQQNRIIEMFNMNLDVESIADKLSIPEGEVRLVIDLKKKFMAMEAEGR